MEEEKPEPKLVGHHDDSPCTARLRPDGECPACDIQPDMQSLAMLPYCTTCDVPLKNLECPKCHVVYEKKS